MSETPTYKAGDHVSVDGYRGVAFYVDREHTDYREVLCDIWDDVETGETFYDYDVEEFPTGMFVCIMVGDDREFIIDVDDLTPLDEDDYCGSCGQIGCGHG